DGSRAEVPVSRNDEQGPRPGQVVTHGPPGVGEAVSLQGVHRIAVADEQCRQFLVHARLPARAAPVAPRSESRSGPWTRGRARGRPARPDPSIVPATSLTATGEVTFHR